MDLLWTPPKPGAPIWPDAIMVAAGLLSSALIAYVLAWLNVNADMNALVFFPLLIPGGAVFMGFVAASGYYVASRLLERRAGTVAIWSVCLSSLLTYAAIFYFRYRMISVHATAVQMRGFLAFVDASIRAPTNHIVHIVGDGRLYGGYHYALLNAAGFMYAGAHLVARAYMRLSCEACHRYLPTPSTVAAYGDQATLAPEFESLKQMSQDGRGDACMAHLERLSQVEDNYKLAIDVAHCQPCRRQYSRLRLMRFVSPRWVVLEGFDHTTQVPSVESAA